MMPYDENVNRFEAARKSFQCIRCAGPTARISQHGAKSTKHNFRRQAADLSTVCGLFPVCGRFFCRIVYIRPVLCYTIYYEIMRSPRRTQHTPAA